MAPASAKTGGEKKAVVGVSTLELAKDLVVENKEVSRGPADCNFTSVGGGS